MKKLLLALVVVFVTGTSLFAWEPEDLTKFPLGQDGKNWILNLGIGFPDFNKFKDVYYFPPVRLSLDKNVEMGDKKLPFFIGGILSYQGHGYKERKWSYAKGEYYENVYYHDFSIGGRFGYHFNWGVNNLDTYAVTTAGWIIQRGDYIDPGLFLYGVNIGARYFISKGFGFWAEGGYNTNYLNLDIGFAFKF